MKKLILLVIVAPFFSGVQAQTTETILRRVADNILSNTPYTFVNKKTGSTYTSLKEVSDPGSVALQSDYNEWYYVNGVLAVAMMQLGDVLNDRKYIDYPLRNFEFIFNNLGYLKDHYDSANYRYPFYQYFRLGKLDDCGAMGAGLADVNKIANKKEYSDYLTRAAQYIMNRQERLKDRTFARPDPRYMTLWADDLYMSVPFLARMGKLTGDANYFNECIRQVENFTRHLYDSTTGLFFHCWYSDVSMNGVAHWGRCNGWVLLAQTELLSHLPANHPKRAQLIKLLLRQIVGLSRYQDKTGMWRQVLDKPDSYLESSCTAMFVYSIAKAVNEKWIDKSYLTIAQKGWEALADRIQDDGQVQGICIGTGIEDNVQFYYERPVELNDIHGLGAVLLAGIEMIKANNK